MGGFCLTYETLWYLQWFTRYRWKQFLIRFKQNWLLSPTSHTKELEFKICSTIHIQYHLFLFVRLIFMQNKYPCILIWEHLGNSNFCKQRLLEKFIFAKILPKTVSICFLWTIEGTIMFHMSNKIPPCVD